MEKWKRKLNKTDLAHITFTTERGTLREFKANRAYHKKEAEKNGGGESCQYCRDIALKLGIEAPPERSEPWRRMRSSKNGQQKGNVLAYGADSHGTTKGTTTRQTTRASIWIDTTSGLRSKPSPIPSRMSLNWNTWPTGTMSRIAFFVGCAC
jgi:hypothetical protein